MAIDNNGNHTAEEYDQSFMRCPNCGERYNTKITHECVSETGKTVRVIPLSFAEFNSIVEADSAPIECSQFGALGLEKGWQIRTSEFRNGVLVSDGIDITITDSYEEFDHDVQAVREEFVTPSMEFQFVEFCAKAWHALGQPIRSFERPTPIVTYSPNGSIQTVTYLIEGK